MANGQMSRRHPRVGDVIEISTRRGFAYGQVTHEHRLYGWLIRVLRGLHATRPAIADLVRMPTSFFTFVALEVGLDEGIFQLIGSSRVPTEAQRLPVFKWSFPARSARDQDWWLWDPNARGPGMNRVHVGKELSPEHRKLPVEERITPSVLIAQLESDWTPEVAHERTGWESLLSKSNSQVGAGVVHSLSFPTQRQAIAAAEEEVRAAQVGTVVRQDETSVDILDAAPASDARVQHLEALAQRHGGEYTGRETRIASDAGRGRAESRSIN